MSNINVLVVESLQLEGSWDRPKKLTVGHVKQGYGKTVGLAAGNLAGAYVGKHAGRMIGNEKDNDKPLDNTKASHRVGALLDRSISRRGLIPVVGHLDRAHAAKQMGYGKTGRVGAALGGPLVGLTTPKAVADKQKQKKK